VVEELGTRVGIFTSRGRGVFTSVLYNVATRGRLLVVALLAITPSCELDEAGGALLSWQHVGELTRGEGGEGGRQPGVRAHECVASFVWNLPRI
jgi:hypothetical protein